MMKVWELLIVEELLFCLSRKRNTLEWIQCSVCFEDYVILLATTVTGGSELRCFNGFVKNGEEVPCCESETEKAIAQCRLVRCREGQLRK